MSKEIDAKFIQEGQGGYADIVIALDGTVTLSGSEKILLSRTGNNGKPEYLDGESGNFSGKDTPLKCKYIKEGNKLIFALEPYYVNNLTRGGHVVTLVNENKDVLGEGDLFIEGVKKSVKGSAYSLASDEVGESENESIESLNKIKESVAAGEAELAAFIRDEDVVDSNVAAVNAGISEKNLDSIKEALVIYTNNLEKVSIGYEKLKAILDNAVNLRDSTKLMMDPKNSPLATELIEKLRSNLQPAFDKYESLLLQKSNLESQIDALKSTLAGEQDQASADAAARAQEEASLRQETAALQVQKTNEAQGIAAFGKKSSLGLIISIVAAILVLGGGAGGYFLMSQDKPAVEEPKAEAPVEEPKAETPVEEPKAETPVEEPKAETPVEEPKAKTPVEEPKAKTPAEEPKTVVLSAKEQISAFLKDKSRTPQKAMELLDSLEIKTKEEQDAAFKLIYFAAMKDETAAIRRYAECMDPRTEQWGSIKKDAVEAYEYYGKINDSEAQSALKSYLDEKATTDATAKEWLEKIK